MQEEGWGEKALKGIRSQPEAPRWPYTLSCLRPRGAFCIHTHTRTAVFTAVPAGLCCLQDGRPWPRLEASLANLGFPLRAHVPD